MSLTEAQIQFGAEFITLMVSASALALIALRPPFQIGSDRAGARLALLRLWSGGGLIVIAAASFVRGSLLVTGGALRWFALGELAAALLIVPALPVWWPRMVPSRLRGRPFAAFGLLAWAAAGAVGVAKGSGYAIDALQVVGAVAIGLAIVVLARRSIALRVATSAAATLLLVVLVLSVSLSAAIATSQQNDELSKLISRANIERSAVTDSAMTPVTQAANFVQADLEAESQSKDPEPLVTLDHGTPGQAAVAAAAIRTELQALSGLTTNTFVLYMPSHGTLLVPGPTPPGMQALASEPTLLPTSCTSGSNGLYSLPGGVYLAASAPECTLQRQDVGTVFAIVPVGSKYLDGRMLVDPTVSLALLDGNRVVASTGDKPTTGDLKVASGFGQDSTVSELVGDQFVGAVHITVRNSPTPLTLLLTTANSTVLSTRTQLYRTLFLIALGGTILALGLAIFTGDRITAGVRRLTTAAGRIQGGETAIRSGIAGSDEVAALGSAFDTMLDSVDSQSAALQAAADEETRLRNRMEAVVAGMSDALVAVDSFGCITDFNRAAQMLTGVSGAEAVGAQASKIVKLTDEDGCPVAARFFAAKRAASSFSGAIRRGPEVSIPVAVSGGGLLGPAGELVGSVFVLRDLRGEREVEQMKTEFLSRVGHELRTPLTGIMGYADILMRRDVPSSRAREWYEEILQSGRRLLRIVEMLEFFASSGAGRMNLRPEPLDVRGLVSGIASSWTSRLPPGVSLGRRVSANLPPVLADRRWLGLAVDELVDNAVKFSPDGGRILMGAELAEPEPGNGAAAGHPFVEIYVKDRGLGMTPEEYAIVFSDFVQGDTSDTRRFGGLGLGLAIVRRVVEGHGGEIRCSSAIGKGSSFVIRIPAAPEGVEAPRSPAKRARRSSTRTRNRP